MTGLVEALSGVVPHQPVAPQIVSELLSGAIGAAVVDHDQLHRHPGWGIGDRQQAAARNAVVVVGWDHHRDARAVAAGQLKGAIQRLHVGLSPISLHHQSMQLRQIVR